MRQRREAVIYLRALAFFVAVSRIIGFVFGVFVKQRREATIFLPAFVFFVAVSSAMIAVLYNFTIVYSREAGGTVPVFLGAR